MNPITIELCNSPADGLSVKFSDSDKHTLRYYGMLNCSQQVLCEFIEKCNHNQISADEIDYVMSDFLNTIQ